MTAPALVQADKGSAIGSGTDVAMESADIVLIRNDLMDVSAAIQTNKATIRNINRICSGLLPIILPEYLWRQGCFICSGPLLNPMIAAGAMAFSSVSVVTNALAEKV